MGVYCACNYCCDQLKAEGEVDIFNAVRIIKKNRPALVPNVVSNYLYPMVQNSSNLYKAILLAKMDKKNLLKNSPAIFYNLLA